MKRSVSLQTRAHAERRVPAHAPSPSQANTTCNAFGSPARRVGPARHTRSQGVAPTPSPHNPYPPCVLRSALPPPCLFFNPRTCTARAVRSPRMERGGATTCVAAHFYVALRNARKGTRRGRVHIPMKAWMFVPRRQDCFSLLPHPSGTTDPPPAVASPSPTLTTAPPRRPGGSPASPGRRRPQSCRSRPPGCRRCRARSPAAGRCASPPRRPGRGSPTSAR